MKLALSPLLLAQAVHTRWRLPKPPEAAGPRQDQFTVDGAPTRARRGLRIVGEPSAAGVGGDQQDDVLAASSARRWRGGWTARQADTSHLPFDLPLHDPTMPARDSSHPGAPLYRLWSQALAEHIASAVWPRLSAAAAARA